METFLFADHSTPTLVTNQSISSLACTAGTGVLITPVGFESTEAILCSSRECHRRGSFKPRQCQSKCSTERHSHGSFKPRQFFSLKPRVPSSLWNFSINPNSTFPLLPLFIHLLFYTYDLLTHLQNKHYDILGTFH